MMELSDLVFFCYKIDRLLKTTLQIEVQTSSTKTDNPQYEI